MRNNQINNSAAVRSATPIWSMFLSWLMLAGIALVLSGCGDSPKAEVDRDGGPGAGGGSDFYKGPPPATEDVQAFKREFWDNLYGSDRCGSCHGVDQAGTPMQSPAFVNQDDINAAYAEAIQVVDLANPGSSIIVSKVGGGHNCWVADAATCAQILETYITAWAGGAAGGSGRAIDLTAPVIRTPGASRSFPDTAQANGVNSFAQTIYPLLSENCSGCHAETSATPQSPFFANGDVNTAYQAAKSKIDLDTPANSRFVLRLRDEFHNCWSVCADDAAEMQSAIATFSGAIALTQIDPDLITSKSLRFGDAIIASGGSRYENNLIALWEFKTGSGSVAYDTSGVQPALDLTFSGAVDWVLGYGIEIINGKAQGSTTNSKKLSDFIKSSGEYSIEAWVVPGNVTQEESSIITYSGGGTVRNFTMGQSLYNYNFLNLSDRTDGTLNSSLTTADADEDLQASLQHVVMNFDPVNGRRIYVNGVFTGDNEGAGNIPASIADWSENFAFVLGNEPGSSALWKGKLRLVAIHNRVLSDAQIQQNFDVGVGQKYLMLFSVADVINVPDSFVMFEVELYDNYSYLFSEPRFINLDPDWTPSMLSSIDIKGMRLGINGKEAVAGQGFANMNVSVTSGQYTVDGQVLTNSGTIIALEKGPEADEFFLTFEQLGSETNNYVEASPVAPQSPADAAMISRRGVRTFDEINATMSAVTGVAVTNAAVSTTFDSYRRQLPAVEDVQAYLSSHQMAVAHLAMKYCDVLVETNPGYFSPFSFAQTPSVAFDTTGKNNVLNPLLSSIMNVDLVDATNNIGSQPNETAIRDMLSSNSAQALGDGYTNTFESLIDCMTRCERGLTECPIYVPTGDTAACTGGETQNTTTRTRQVVKAACAATLGSAVMLIQ